MQARAAVSKAESKVAKLEAQISALVELHDAATAELVSSRSKLAEAEAATAKAASVALPPEHYWAALSADPGPFWSAFKAVIMQKCPGMPDGVLGHLDEATKAFEAALTPIFVRGAPAQTLNQGMLPKADDSSTPNPPGNGGLQSPNGPLSGVAANPVLAPRGVGEPREVAMQTNADAEQQAAAAAAIAGQQQLQQQAQLEQQQQAQSAAAAAEAAAAAALQQEQAAAAAQQAAAAALAQQQAAAAAAAAEAAIASAASHAAGVPVADEGADGADPARNGSGSRGRGAENDPMGGGAADGVANKRNIDAVQAAKCIAAKAKAKSAP